ncbi:MAG: gliding motility-associated C-terminal domain-containing protein [Elusimicrobia bacterium]|nr:gliding motility-associated C-terminal domain-containing protein [Elusimicrobiota bacterium]
MNRAFAILLAAAALLAPIRAASSPSALGQSVAMTRMVTPNGDGRNDIFIFRCYNPRDAAIEAKIFDVSGREVSNMRLKQRSNGAPPVTDNVSGAYYDLEWNPNSGGRAAGGVYLYQVRVETKVYKGTITVIR